MPDTLDDDSARYPVARTFRLIRGLSYRRIAVIGALAVSAGLLGVLGFGRAMMMADGWARSVLSHGVWLFPLIGLLTGLVLGRSADDVVVGSDGFFVTHWRRFISYSRVRAVRHTAFQRVDRHQAAMFLRVLDGPASNGTWGSSAVQSAGHWCGVEIELTDGETIFLPTFYRMPSEHRRARREQEVDAHSDALGKAVADAIENGWAAGCTQAGPEETAQIRMLARSGRRGREWLGALRALAAGTGMYRSAGVQRETAWQILADVRKGTAMRAAAAVLLDLDNDPKVAQHLRLAAASTADPTARIVFERLAKSPSDVALADVLDGLHESDTEDDRVDTGGFAAEPRQDRSGGSPSTTEPEYPRAQRIALEESDGAPPSGRTSLVLRRTEADGMPESDEPADQRSNRRTSR